MKTLDLSELLSTNAYPGRGIVIGTSDDGKYAVTAYFIMGRSASSRNRVFTTTEDGIQTEAFDPSTLLVAPELIIYHPVRVLGNTTIVTNGDQTDTVRDGLAAGKTFEESLRERKYEHDAPNYTPRISGVMNIVDGKYDFALSILKSDDGDPECCIRNTYTYDVPKAGVGRFIHTYMGDGNPLPSFEGEPEKVALSGNIDEFTNMVWTSLNEDNKVSLFVRYIDIATGEADTRIINKNV